MLGSLGEGEGGQRVWVGGPGRSQVLCNPAQGAAGSEPGSWSQWLEFGPWFCTLGASLVTQLVKNQPGMQETWVQSLCQEDPLEKEMATHSRILDQEILWTDWWATIYGSQRIGHN